MARNPVLLDRLRNLISADISNADCFHTQQLQARSARVLAAISSTPFSDFAVPATLVQHPEMLDILIAAAMGGGRPATRHEVVRIMYNVSFAPECAKILGSSGAIEHVLLPILEGHETGPCVAMRTLWAIVAIANLVSTSPEDHEDAALDAHLASSRAATAQFGGWEESGGGHARGPRKQADAAMRKSQLRGNEVHVLVAALDASLHDGSLDDVDPELYGTFGCVDVTEAHDASLRIYPYIILVPLRRLARLPLERDVLIRAGICSLMMEFIRVFVRARKTDYDKALRKAEADRKVAGATGPAGGEMGSSVRQPSKKPATGSTQLGSVEDDFGLPELDSEEDMQQRRSISECLGLIRVLSRSPAGALALQNAGGCTVVASLIVNRSLSVREEVCRTIETLSSAATAARRGMGGDMVEGDREGEGSDSMATDLLAGALFDREYDVRMTAARALGTVYEPSHRVGAKRVLKALGSSDPMVRRAAVGALGSIHRVAHHKYFVQRLAGQKPTGGGDQGAADGDGGLLSTVLTRLFVKDRGVRISSACAVLEMCALSMEEEALPAEMRSRRQFTRDSCCWGAEGVADMILSRLRQAVEEGVVSTTPILSPVHSPLASAHSPMAKSVKLGSRGAISKGNHRISSPAGKDRNVHRRKGEGMAKDGGNLGAVRGEEADGGTGGGGGGGGGQRLSKDLDDENLQLEGLRLLLCLIGVYEFFVHVVCCGVATLRIYLFKRCEPFEATSAVRGVGWRDGKEREGQ